MNRLATRSPAPAEKLSREDWKLVLLLSAINITHILDFVIVMPLADQLREQLQINPSQFSYIVSAYGLSAMFSGILASTVIDRFDRRHSMLWSLAGFTAATFYCGWAPGFSHLLWGRLLAGAFGGVVASTVMAFIVDCIPSRRRGKAIGVVSSSFAFSSTIGLPIGLTLAEQFGNFRAPFLAIGLLAVVVFLVSWIRLPSKVGLSAASQESPWKQFLIVARQPNHLWSFAFMFAMVLGTFMIVPFIAAYMVANSGLPREYLALLYGIGGIFTLIFVNLVGWLTDRVGPRPMFFLTAGSAIVLTFVLTNLPVVSITMNILVATLFMMVASSRIVPAQAMMLRSADPQTRGAFTSLNSAVTHLATGTAPLISGWVVSESVSGGPLTGFWLAGWLAAGFGILALVLSGFLHEEQTRISEDFSASPEDLNSLANAAALTEPVTGTLAESELSG